MQFQKLIYQQPHLFLYWYAQGSQLWLAPTKPGTSLGETDPGWVICFDAALLKQLSIVYAEACHPVLLEVTETISVELDTTCRHTVNLLARMLTKEEITQALSIRQNFLFGILLHFCIAYREQYDLTALPADWVRLHQLLMQQYKDQRSPAFYAEALSCSVRQLNQLSRAVTGKLLSELITERLLAEAIRLLLETEMRIKEIAYDLNFTDQTHFAKFFRKGTGYSPLIFRATRNNARTYP